MVQLPVNTFTHICVFLCATSPHLLKRVVCVETGRIVCTRRPNLHVRHAESRGWVQAPELKVTTTMWPFCISWCGVAAHEKPKIRHKPLILRRAQSQKHTESITQVHSADYLITVFNKSAPRFIYRPVNYSVWRHVVLVNASLYIQQHLSSVQFTHWWNNNDETWHYVRNNSTF